MAETKGLAGVVVADTRKSKVDGENGILYYGGYNILDLAENASFEEVAYLLWNDQLPTQSELNAFEDQVNTEMQVPGKVLDALKMLPKNTHPMAALRTAVSMLGCFDDEADDPSLEANQRKALRLLAKTPTLVAAWAQIREGKEPITPNVGVSLAENFMYMFKGGVEPTQTEIDATNVYLILLADHGFNASTFTSRVVTSTEGDMYSAVTAAIGALKGPKHGGANEAAMNMFMEIGSEDAVEDFFYDEVKGNDRKIMGIGHRVYKAPDPRATVLREHADALAGNGANEKWFNIASKLEDLALADQYFIERKLFANVDYYSAIVLYSLGIEPDIMTPLFAMSRMAGWTAHIIEQWNDNRLIRPRANYIGDVDLEWLPIEER
ncbi:MAG: citrate/2-methylcitrate synthase [Chloroflexi bacterium]|nr:citrate/2-methylcitrate synthase [Chloroflexota bacterium]